MSMIRCLQLIWPCWPALKTYWVYPNKFVFKAVVAPLLALALQPGSPLAAAVLGLDWGQAVEDCGQRYVLVQQSFFKSVGNDGELAAVHWHPDIKRYFLRLRPSALQLRQAEIIASFYQNRLFQIDISGPWVAALSASQVDYAALASQLRRSYVWDRVQAEGFQAGANRFFS